MRRQPCAAVPFVEDFASYTRQVLENSGYEHHNLAHFLERETGRDFWGERLENLRHAFAVVAEATFTLPKGQLVRPEWPRAFAELVLVFHGARGKAQRELMNQEMARARASTGTGG